MYKKLDLYVDSLRPNGPLKNTINIKNIVANTYGADFIYLLEFCSLRSQNYSKATAPGFSNSKATAPGFSNSMIKDKKMKE